MKLQKEEWEKAKDEAFKKIGPKCKVDGFRPGKMPKELFTFYYILYCDHIELH